MSIHHYGYGALKISTWVLGLVAAVIVSVDPTVKVAIIVAIPSVLTGIGTLVLGFMNRKLTQDMKLSVDGNLTRLLNQKDQQAQELADKSEKLAHAEGHREGVESKDPGTKEGEPHA